MDAAVVSSANSAKNKARWDNLLQLVCPLKLGLRMVALMELIQPGVNPAGGSNGSHPAVTPPPDVCDLVVTHNMLVAWSNRF